MANGAPTLPLPSWARSVFYIFGWAIIPAVAIGAVVYAYERNPTPIIANAPDRYTGSQATADWTAQHRKDDEQDKRISALENSTLRRLDVLEERLKNLSDQQAAGFNRIEKRLDAIK